MMLSVKNLSMILSLNLATDATLSITPMHRVWLLLQCVAWLEIETL